MRFTGQRQSKQGGGGHADTARLKTATFEHSCIPHGTNNETV